MSDGHRWAVRSAAVIVAFVASRCFAATAFERLQPGVELASFVTTPPGRPTIEFTVLRVEPRYVRVAVVDLRHLRATVPGVRSGQLAYSLRELDRLRRPLAMINGGFTNSLVLPQPSGFVKIAGRVMSKLNVASNKQSGALCISHGADVTILKSNSDGLGRCEDALQSGPIVVEDPGKNGIKPGAVDARFARSIIGVDEGGRVLLVQTSAASLFDVAEALIDQRTVGLRVRTALNLDGDADSGLLIHRRGSDLVRGNVDATIPNAIAIVARTPSGPGH